MPTFVAVWALVRAVCSLGQAESLHHLVQGVVGDGGGFPGSFVKDLVEHGVIRADVVVAGTDARDGADGGFSDGLFQAAVALALELCEGLLAGLADEDFVEDQQVVHPRGTGWRAAVRGWSR